MIKRLLICSATLGLLTACAEDYYSSQYPAPIYGGQPDIEIRERPPIDYPRQPPPPDDNVVTQPFKDYVPDSRPLPSEPEPKRGRDVQDRGVVPVEPEPPRHSPRSEIVPQEKVQELPPLVQESPVTAAPEPESQASAEYKPLESNAPISTPVDALVLAAKEDSASGNLEAAGASIERAIRIKPRNANLYYKLAVIRLDQSQPRLAEDLAKKAALLASDDNTLKKHSWLLIARARELQNNPDGAEVARKKANGF